MSANGDHRSRMPRRGIRRLTKSVLGAVLPTERQILTREGFVYFLGGVLLLAAGLWQQVNLILLVFTLSAGPFLASIFGGRAMLRRLSVPVRRSPRLRFFRRSAGHRLYPGKWSPLVRCSSRCSSKIRWFPSTARSRERSA